MVQLSYAAVACVLSVAICIAVVYFAFSGRYDRDTTFAPDDHRNYNRHGEAFDVGETFSGVPYEVGLDAAQASQILSTNLERLLEPRLVARPYAAKA